MKQRKLLNKIYQACVTGDVERQQQLRRQEFAKIIRRKAQGKPFDTTWTVVQV
jgi:hypothetical protein